MVIAILAGVSAFIATNIDDILLLTIFFSQVDGNFRRRHVVVGQYLGFIVLLFISLLGYFGALSLRPEWIGLLGFAPIVIGINKLAQSQKREKGEAPSIDPTKNNARAFLLKNLFNPHIYSVAAVTIANGADNIGIYIPLFSRLSQEQVVVVIVVFLSLIGIWLLIADRLGSHPLVLKIIVRFGHIIVPLVLISLGIYILVESGTATAIQKLITGVF